MVEGAYGSGPASRIAPGLWQGGFPIDPDELGRAGFSCLVLCARELQPAPSDPPFTNVHIVLAPMDDWEMEGDELARTVTTASRAALEVCGHLAAGGRVLVTCAAGRNRSGLVTALALVGRYGMSGSDAVRTVQARRRDALTNDSFVDFLGKIPKRSSSL